MKKTFLTILCAFFMSFSFAQDKGPAKLKPGLDLKKSSVTAVKYFQKHLKLDKKQNAIFMNEFSEYANNITKAIKKNSKEGEITDKRDSQKSLHQYMLRFSSKRDKSVKECLKKKQIVLYDDFIRHIHPFTLEIRTPKKRK